MVGNNNLFCVCRLQSEHRTGKDSGLTAASVCHQRERPQPLLYYLHELASHNSHVAARHPAFALDPELHGADSKPCINL